MKNKASVLAMTAAVAVTGAVAAGSSAGAVASQLVALAEVAPGEWQLKEIGGTETRTVCLADPAQLLQIQHGAANCLRQVLESDAKAVTISYTCAGAGNGRTTLTVRSPQSLKVETQGILRGAPFAFDYDAKRIGECPSAAPADIRDEGKARPGQR